MRVPRFEVLRVFERAHFTPAELEWFRLAAVALLRAEGLSPDDVTLTRADYADAEGS